MKSEIVIKTDTRIVAIDVQYQSYWPRFLVEVKFGELQGTIEVCAECEKTFYGFTRNKEEQREELENMTIFQVRNKALVKAVEGDWLCEPTLET